MDFVECENNQEIKNNEKKGVNCMFADEKCVYVGDSSLVTPVKNKDYNDYVALSKPRQELPGFDVQYHDFVEYIIGITHSIWEEKNIGVIYDTYSNNIVLHLGSFNANGLQGVIAGTLQTLFSFPDRRLIGQDVIWSEHGESGFLSSHRILSTATNLNPSSFGPATGKKVSFRTTVDCAAENNRIYEEWLVRDNLWIVRQLGFDPYDVARNLARGAMKSGQAPYVHLGLSENKNGQFSPDRYVAQNNSVGEFILEALGQIYNYRLFGDVKKYYAEEAILHFICDQDLIGHNQIQGMLICLFSSFPNASFVVERVTCNALDGENNHSVAVRWRINGIHEGLGYFGSPSGKPVTVLGISHFTIRNNKITEEWFTIDGIDVLKQIVNIAD